MATDPQNSQYKKAVLDSAIRKQQEALRILDTAAVTSAAFKAAQKTLKQISLDLPSLQADYEATASREEVATEQATTKKALADAKTALADATTRATAKGLNPKTDTNVADKARAAAEAQAKADAAAKKTAADALAAKKAITDKAATDKAAAEKAAADAAAKAKIGLTIPSGAKISGTNVVDSTGKIIGTVNADGKTYKPTIASATPTPTPTVVKPTKVVPPVTPTDTTSDAAKAAAQAKAEAFLNGNGDMGKYAVQMALINSDQSLKDLFYNDVYLPILNGKSPVDPAKFKADLQNTNWFKSYAEPAREAEAIKYGDPSSWAASVQAATDLINREATSAGYDITPDQATTLAELALHKSGGKAEGISGLTLTDVQLQLKNLGKINIAGGQAATDVSTLKAFAGDYAVAHLYNDATLTGWADQIAKGKTTLAAVEKQMKDTAISSYSALAPQINAGLTVKSIISPYTQLYGTTLEVDPNAQDLSDPTFANTMFTKDAKDPNVQVLKPLWQYQSDLKKDPRWAYTDNARASLDTVGRNVLKDMGFKY